VSGISWPAILTHISGLISAKFLIAFATVVAFFAQALKLPGPEQNGISSMWNHVISNGCWYDATSIEMHGA
jgi:hypothetical protein